VKELVFADTDICLDVLMARQSFYKSSARLFTLSDQKKIQIAVSSLSFSNIHYILRHDYSLLEARKILTRFKVLTNVLAVNEKIIELALQSDFKDFEDAIQYYTAIEHGIKTIVTRNLKDFKMARIPVMSPDEFLKSFES
jgi:predicted nucleic acid-binding protein